MPSNTTPPVVIRQSESDISDLLLPYDIKRRVIFFLEETLGGYNTRFYQSKSGHCNIESTFRRGDKEYILKSGAMLVTLYEKESFGDLLVELFDKFSKTLKRIKDGDFTQEIVYVKEDAEPIDVSNRLFEMTVKS